jgi:hypothetical protein
LEAYRWDDSRYSSGEDIDRPDLPPHDASEEITDVLGSSTFNEEVDRHAAGKGMARYGHFKEHVVYKTKRDSFVFFPVNPYSVAYVPVSEHVNIECFPDAAAATSCPAHQQPAVETRRPYDNLHVRFSIKNYTDDISPGEAELMLEAIDAKCEPVDSVQDTSEGELVRVSVLINMGPGALQPFATVRKSSKRLEPETTHIKIAIGLSSCGNPARSKLACFQGFEAGVLDIIRRAACSPVEVAEYELALGSNLNMDRQKCMGERASR